MIAPEGSCSAHKKTKRKLEPPASVDSDAPAKKKNKKKAKEKAEELNLQLADEPTLSPDKKKKKKRANEEEEELNLHPSDELMLNPDKKKKKLECLKSPPVPVHINTPEKKKKAKKKKKTEECVVEVRSQGEKKKKKKKQTSVTIESPNHQEAGVSTETQVTTTKDKRNDGGKKKIKEAEKTSSSNEDANRSRLESLDWELVEELEEYIPGVKNKSVSSVRVLLRDDLHRFRSFKQQGIALRRGRFSVEENRRIISNVSDFLALTGIKSAVDLFPQLSRDTSSFTRKMRMTYRFQERLAEGIARPVSVVYTRALKLLDDINRVGRFSKEEVERLKKLQHIHGNNWATISKKMDRSNWSLQKRFCTLGSNHGYWTAEEELRLKRAIKDYYETLIQQGPPGSGLNRDQLFNNLPWKLISQKVETRSWLQCRKKWFNILKNRLTTDGSVFSRREESCHAKICLINTLYEMCVEDPADIDWDVVAHTVGQVTPMCVQKAFNRLKIDKVPNWTRLSYDEIISFLKLHVVPYLMSRVKSESRWAERREQYGEDRYDLAQIFDGDDLDGS